MDLAKKYAGEVNELRRQLQAAQEKIMELEMAKEVAVAAAQANQGHLRGAQVNQQAGAGQEVAKLRAELETKQKRIDELGSSVALKDSELEWKRRGILVLENAVASKDGELEAKRGAVNGLRASEQKLKVANEQLLQTQTAKRVIKEEDDDAHSIELLRTQLAARRLKVEQLEADLEASATEVYALRASPYSNQAELEKELHNADANLRQKESLAQHRLKENKELTEKLNACESAKAIAEQKLRFSRTETSKLKKELKEMKKAGEQRFTAPSGGFQSPITESYGQMKKRPSPYIGMQGHDPKRSKSFSAQASEHEDDEEPHREERKIVVGRGREGDNIRESPY